MRQYHLWSNVIQNLTECCHDFVRHLEGIVRKRQDPHVADTEHCAHILELARLGVGIFVLRLGQDAHVPLSRRLAQLVEKLLVVCGCASGDCGDADVVTPFDMVGTGAAHVGEIMRMGHNREQLQRSL